MRRCIDPVDESAGGNYVTLLPITTAWNERDARTGLVGTPSARERDARTKATNGPLWGHALTCPPEVA
jgi:hypothetical protein